MRVGTVALIVPSHEECPATQVRADHEVQGDIDTRSRSVARRTSASLGSPRPRRSGRRGSKSGSIRTCSSSARGAGPSATRRSRSRRYHDIDEGTANTRSRIHYRYCGFEPTKPGMGGQR
jgi:hypothetical protein